MKQIKNPVSFIAIVIILFLLMGCTSYESSIITDNSYKADYPYAFYDIIAPYSLIEEHKDDNEPSIAYEPYQLDVYTEEAHRNPFFFPHGTTIVTYEGSFWLDSVINQDINLNINLIKEINGSYLYSIHLDQLEYDGPFSQMHGYRLHLGFFYVTPQAIYNRWPPSFHMHGEYNESYEDFANRVNAIVIEELENYGIDGWSLVSSNDIVGSVATQGQWRSYIEIEGNRRIFRVTNVDSFQGATRFYERIVWEEGRGIIHYLSGYGAMRDHMEIAIVGVDTDMRRLTYTETFVNLFKNKLPFIYIVPWRDSGWGTPAREIMFLNDYLVYAAGADDYVYRIEYFAIVDMDGDGIPELILTEWPGRGRLVLHYRNGTIFGTSFPFRGLRTIKTDGTFDISGSGGNGMIARLHFGRDLAEQSIIYYWDWRSSASTFYFNGEPVSLEEQSKAIERAMEYFNSKEDVTWHPFYGDWMEAFERPK